MVQLVFVVYLLAIFEGALRKWVAPQFGQYLFFIRDPVVVLVYLIATRHALWPRGSPLFALGLAMAALGAALPVLQAAVGGFGELRLLLAVYGWRSYFLYIPLAFLVGAQFDSRDLTRLYKLTLWLAVPVAVLVAIQFSSPPAAPINAGIAEDEALQFRGIGLVKDRVRPQGPFASVAGQQVFVASAFAVLLAFYVAPRHVPQPSTATLLVTGAGVLTCIALSGSRGTVLQCGLSVVFALLAAVLGRGGALRGRALIWPLVIAGGAVALYPLVFPDGHSAFIERWIAADRAESRLFETGVFGRALYGLVDFVRLIDVVPALGYGLGYGGNASITLGATVDGIMPGHLAETDFSRHMVDLGPAFGLVYIAFRIALVTWLATLVLRVTRAVPDPLPMLLLSFSGYILLMGQITGQGTISLFGWLFTGLLIAACRHAHAPRPVRREGTGRLLSRKNLR